MSNDDFLRLQRNLNMPPHTPLKTQIELLKSDMTRLLGEILTLRNDLHAANQAQVALFNEMSETADRSHAEGANALREAALEVCCPDCSIALKQLTAERIFQ
jgi:hypothetical protein